MFGRRTLISALMFTLACSAVAGCSNKSNEAKTTVPVAWRSPDFSGASFENFFVIGIASTEERRHILEDAMVKALEGEGAQATASYELFPDEAKLEKARVLTKIQERGFDGVLITKLLHVDVTDEYVEGKTRYEPTSNLDLYAWDYSQKYDEIHEPGYFRKSETYNVETTLYDATNGDKVGYIVSATVDPENVQQIMGSVATTAVDSLQAAQLIR